MKKSIALLLLQAIFISIFIGCQSDTKNESQSKSRIADRSPKIKLKWLAQWYGEGKKETLIREIAREFSLLHQNIEIELVFPHQMAKIKPFISTSKYTTDAILKMVKYNNWPYDIMLCDATLYKRVGDSLSNQAWGKEYLVNFREKPWLINSHKENFFGSNFHTEIYKGIAPGAFIEGVWNILYVSSFVENRLGIKVKQEDMSISDFYKYAQSVFKYNQSHTDKITFLDYPVAI